MQVEEGLEKATHNERHGTDFDLVPSAELFYEDKVIVQTSMRASVPVATAMKSADHDYEHDTCDRRGQDRRRRQLRRRRGGDANSRRC